MEREREKERETEREREHSSSSSKYNIAVARVLGSPRRMYTKLGVTCFILVYYVDGSKI